MRRDERGKIGGEKASAGDDCSSWEMIGMVEGRVRSWTRSRGVGGWGEQGAGYKKPAVLLCLEEEGERERRDRDPKLLAE